MAQTSILLSGFGGQGILFAGKFLAYKGLIEDKNVSWLPSYGPEMRGGTANCSVIVSDEAVASPIITEPELLVVMNGPSLDKFENAVIPGGKIFIDSTLISRECTRDDVSTFRIPATQMANDMGIPKLANMIMVGKLIKETNMFTWEQLIGAVTKLVPPAKAAMLESNIKALEAGYNF